MNEKNRIKNNISYNEKWLARDHAEVKRKKIKFSREWGKNFNGKSPEIMLDGDEIKWKRFTKHG